MKDKRATRVPKEVSRTLNGYETFDSTDADTKSRVKNLEEIAADRVERILWAISAELAMWIEETKTGRLDANGSYFFSALEMDMMEKLRLVKEQFPELEVINANRNQG